LTGVGSGLTRMSKSDIQDLQVKIAFLEDSLSKISDEFFLQQRELEDLKAKYVGLSMKMRGIQNHNQSASEVIDEKPPHY